MMPSLTAKRSLSVAWCLLCAAWLGCTPAQPDDDTPAEPQAAAAVADRHSTRDTVEISGMIFHPAELSVHPGDTVVWINRDLVVHDVTQRPDETWTSDTIAVGDSWQMVVDRSFDYRCSLHPTMEGAVRVED